MNTQNPENQPMIRFTTNEDRLSMLTKMCTQELFIIKVNNLSYCLLLKMISSQDGSRLCLLFKAELVKIHSVERKYNDQDHRLFTGLFNSELNGGWIQEIKEIIW